MDLTCSLRRDLLPSPHFHTEKEASGTTSDHCAKPTPLETTSMMVTAPKVLLCTFLALLSLSTLATCRDVLQAAPLNGCAMSPGSPEPPECSGVLSGNQWCKALLHGFLASLRLKQYSLSSFAHSLCSATRNRMPRRARIPAGKGRKLFCRQVEHPLKLLSNLLFVDFRRSAATTTTSSGVVPTRSTAPSIRVWAGRPSNFPAMLTMGATCNVAPTCKASCQAARSRPSTAFLPSGSPKNPLWAELKVFLGVLVGALLQSHVKVA